MDKAAILIDSGYIFAAKKDRGITESIDFSTLSDAICEKLGVERSESFFFDACMDPERVGPDDVEAENRRNVFFSTLKKSGFEISLGRLVRDEKGGFKQKMVDVNIALCIADLSASGKVETIILMSGDSDLAPAVERAVKKGTKVIVAEYTGSATNAGRWLLQAASSSFEIDSDFLDQHRINHFTKRQLQAFALNAEERMLKSEGLRLDLSEFYEKGARKSNKFRLIQEMLALGLKQQRFCKDLQALLITFQKEKETLNEMFFRAFCLAKETGIGSQTATKLILGALENATKRFDLATEAKARKKAKMDLLLSKVAEKRCIIIMGEALWEFRKKFFVEKMDYGSFFQHLKHRMQAASADVFYFPSSREPENLTKEMKLEYENEKKWLEITLSKIPGCNLMDKTDNWLDFLEGIASSGAIDKAGLVCMQKDIEFLAGKINGGLELHGFFVQENGSRKNQNQSLVPHRHLLGRMSAYQAVLKNEGKKRILSRIIENGQPPRIPKGLKLPPHRELKALMTT